MLNKDILHPQYLSATLIRNQPFVKGTVKYSKTNLHKKQIKNCVKESQEWYLTS